VDGSFGVRATARAGTAELSWDDRSPAGVRPFYRVFRSRPLVPAPDPTLPPGRDGIRCLTPPTGYLKAFDCRLAMKVVGVTHARRLVDRPPPGRWVYRVGLAANWRDDPSGGDVMLLSAPTRSASAASSTRAPSTHGRDRSASSASRAPRVQR